MDEKRKDLTDWPVDPGKVHPGVRWFPGENLNVLPRKAQLRAAGFETVLFGWKPDSPIINPDTRVLALGSCFARYFIIWLGDRGFNRSFQQSPYDGLIRFDFPFESAAVVAQQFRWAFEKFDPKHAVWFATSREQIQPTEDARLLARETLQKAEVIIITLGLSEVWYDKTTDEPMWRAVPSSSYDPSRHAFKVMSVADTVAALEEIHAIREQYMPETKIVFTVSPIRLRATFRPVSALAANSVSKAIIRAAVDEFLRAHWDDVNKRYFYFPSYEIVTELIADPFLPDMRHVYEHVPQQVMALFAKNYTTLPPDDVRVVPESGEEDLRRTIRELEDNVVELQRVSDERIAVIEGLAKAADERLKVIEQLDAELARLRGR